MLHDTSSSLCFRESELNAFVQSATFIEQLMNDETGKKKNSLDFEKMNLRLV